MQLVHVHAWQQTGDGVDVVLWKAEAVSGSEAASRTRAVQHQEWAMLRSTAFLGCIGKLEAEKHKSFHKFLG